MDGPSDTIRPSYRLLILATALIAVLVFICPLGVGIPLVDPDEGLHASIAQEMVEKGDWVTPRFQGEAFLDKPILFTWAQAVSLKLFGMNAAAVRLPGLLFGLAAMITTGIIGWRIYSPTAGFLAAMLYGTMILPTILAQLPVHDAALIPFASLAILLFWEADRAVGFRSKAILTVTIGVLLGLTCLTKGLVGVGLVGIAYGSYLLVTRRLTPEACVRGAAALSIAGLTALPWYLAMESRIPGYLHYYFVERHLLGLATESQRHSGKPAWYYLPILLGGGLTVERVPPGCHSRLVGGTQITRATGYEWRDDAALVLVDCLHVTAFCGWLEARDVYLACAAADRDSGGWCMGSIA